MGDRELTEDEVADLKEAFAMFDINGDGTCALGAVRTEVSCLAEEGTRRKQQEEEVPEATSQEIDASVLQYRDCASGIF